MESPMEIALLAGYPAIRLMRPLRAAFVACGALTLALLAPAATAAGTSGTAAPALQSAAALVVDESGRPLYTKHTHDRKPIASITKLMTAMVVLDSGVPLDESITILESDRDLLRHSHSRMRIDRSATLTRREMLSIALMSSDNRAASALGRTALPGGKPAFVVAMNRKAQSLGMTDSRFADPTGLDGDNRSTAEDLAKMVRAAAGYPLIREITSRGAMQVHPYGDATVLEYRNTNPLVRSPDWQVELSKTGFVNEAGHCLVMRTVINGRRLDIVLLDAAGKRSPVGDASRLRKWLMESGAAGSTGRVASSAWDAWE
jgi:serine-type D-Ala-D-Ala endopeptidase (penicillin-binding protein 7)